MHSPLQISMACVGALRTTSCKPLLPVLLGSGSVVHLQLPLCSLLLPTQTRLNPTSQLPKCIACPADGGRCCRAMSLNMDPRNFDERRAVVDVANLERQLEEGTSSGHSSALRPEALRQYHRTKEQIDPGHHEGL